MVKTVGHALSSYHLTYGSRFAYSRLCTYVIVDTLPAWPGRKVRTWPYSFAMVGLMVAITRLPHFTRTALAAATSGISDLRVETHNAGAPRLPGEN